MVVAFELLVELTEVVLREGMDKCCCRILAKFITTCV